LAGYLKSVPAGYATETWVNSQGFLTSLPSWIGSSKPSYSLSEITGNLP